MTSPSGRFGGPRNLIVISHLRWTWVWQRPQQLVSRLPSDARVWFVEVPLPADVAEPQLRWADVGPVRRVWLEIPYQAATSAAFGGGVEFDVAGAECYVDLLTGFVQEEVGRLDADPTEVVFTAHSLPSRILEMGDPYPDQLPSPTAARSSAMHSGPPCTELTWCSPAGGRCTGWQRPCAGRRVPTSSPAAWTPATTPRPGGCAQIWPAGVRSRATSA